MKTNLPSPEDEFDVTLFIFHCMDSGLHQRPGRITMVVPVHSHRFQGGSDGVFLLPAPWAAKYNQLDTRLLDLDFFFLHKKRFGGGLIEKLHAVKKWKNTLRDTRRPNQS